MNDTVFANIYGQQNEAAPSLKPSMGNLLGSAMRLDNDVANALDWLTRPTYERDFNFDYRAQFDTLKLPNEWRSSLAASNNLQEFNDILGRIQREEKDRAVVAAGGFSGMVASMAAGTLSPTAFIPFVGQGRRGVAMAEILGLGLAGATAQEAILYNTQETRTGAEAFSGIAAQTMFSGLLGGAWLGLTPRGRARMVRNENFGRSEASIITPSGRESFDIEEPPMRLRDDEPGISPAEYAGTVFARAVDAPTTDLPSLNMGTLRYASSAVQRNFEDMTPESILEELESLAGSDFVKAVKDSGVEPQEILKRLTDEYEASGLKRQDDLREDALAEATADGAPVGGDVVEPLGMAPRSERATIPETEAPALRGQGEGGSVGAAQTRARNTQGVDLPANAARRKPMQALGKMSPLYRMQMSRMFPGLRDAGYKLATGGLRQKGLGTAQPSARGGTVEDRIRGHDPNLVTYMQAIDKAYYKYLYPEAKEDPGRIAVTIAQVRSRFNAIPPGKMDWHSFNAKVYDDLSTGVVDEATQPAVSAFKDFFAYYSKVKKDYEAELEAMGLEVDPLYKEIEGDELGGGVNDYAHQIYDDAKIRENSSEFLQEHADFFRKDLENSFDAAHARYSKRLRDLESRKNYIKLSDQEKANALAEVQNSVDFIDELPEMITYREARLDISREGRDTGADPSLVRRQLKDLADTQPESVKALLAERQSLMRQARVMKELGGNADELVEAARSGLSRQLDLIEGMFRKQPPRITAADAALAKTEKAREALLSKAKKPVRTALEALVKREEELERLSASKRSNPVSSERVEKQIAANKLKFAEALERLDRAENKALDLGDRIASINAAREVAVQEAARLVRSRATRADEYEAKLEEAVTKILTPEETAARLKGFDDSIEALTDEFQTRWTSRGNDSEKMLDGERDFTRAAFDEATYYMQKLSHSEVQSAYFNARQDVRGAELMRMVRMPYEIKGKWLIKDTELIARAYDRVMGPDLEIWRAFDGRVNGQNVLDEMSQVAADLMQNIGLSKYVKLPAGFLDKSLAYVQRVKDNVADITDGEDMFLGAKNFSNEGGSGFVPLTDELKTQLINHVRAELKHQTRNYDVAIKRLRNTRMVPDNAESISWRVGSWFKQANVATMMGNVVVSSISDIARPIYRYGMERTMKHGWLPFITNVKSANGVAYRMKAKEVNRQIALTLEPFLHSRAQSMFDTMDQITGGKTLFERGTKFVANKTGIVALFDYWTAGMKSVAAGAAHATMASYVPIAVRAISKGGELAGDDLNVVTYLRSLGLRDEDLFAINHQMELPGGLEKFANGGALPNLSDWTNMSAYRAYSAAVQNEVNKIIVTPGLEKPNWTDENMAYSLVAQFRSFSFAANSKMMMSNIQGNDPYLIQGVLSSLALGALSYYTYAMSVGGKTQETMEKADTTDWLYEAVDRSGLLGALSIGQRLGEQIPVLNQYEIFGGADKPFRRPSGLLGTAFGPTMGKAESIVEYLKTMDSDDPATQERARSLLRQVFVPYQNHFLLRRAFSKVGDAINETFGS